MRVYKKRYYLMREHPGLSGFKRWEQWEYYITTGHKASSNRTKIVGEYKPTGKGIYRLGDGHIPDHQPRTIESSALHWLDENPYQRITPV